MSNNSCFNIRWAFNLSNWKPLKEQWKLAIQCVQKEEKERCYKFCFMEDCKAAMIGRLLMRRAVNYCCQIPYSKVRFSRTPSGKPFLLNETKNFDFNISHHGDFCVIACTTSNLNIGIDIMKVGHKGRNSVNEFFSVMKRQFSSYEWNFISQPGLEMEQLRRFYRLWCLKESYVKAIGTGIASDLQSISFSCPTLNLHEGIKTTDTKLYLKGILQTNWLFEETFIDKDHCVAVALEPKDNASFMNYDNNISRYFTILSFDELVKDSIPFEDTEESFWETFQSKKQKQ